MPIHLSISIEHKKYIYYMSHHRVNNTWFYLNVVKLIYTLLIEN